MAPNKQYPKVSVIICTFNGERGIEACLKGLLNQAYPADKMSIIVVDDGCTDNTPAIAQKYGVKVISHGRNLGVQYARNTGLKAAKGDIIVYLDDDCLVSEQWLKELVAPFADPKVVGVGGRVIAYETKRLSERFMEATGYGNPEPLVVIPGNMRNPIRRVRAYLYNMYRPITVATSPVEAQAVYTANVAYRGSAMRTLGGFDSSLRSNEDSDIATRLKANGDKLMFAPAAVVRHRHHRRVWHVLRQTYYRAGDTYLYYKKNKLLPPLFPFPFLYVLLGGLLAFPAPFVALLWVVTGPAVLYNSWILHAFRARKAEYVVYAYIQLLRETAALLGFLRGALALGHSRSVVGSYAIRNNGARKQ